MNSAKFSKDFMEHEERNADSYINRCSIVEKGIYFLSSRTCVGNVPPTHYTNLRSEEEDG